MNEEQVHAWLEGISVRLCRQLFADEQRLVAVLGRWMQCLPPPSTNKTLNGIKRQQHSRQSQVPETPWTPFQSSLLSTPRRSTREGNADDYEEYAGSSSVTPRQAIKFLDLAAVQRLSRIQEGYVSRTERWTSSNGYGKYVDRSDLSADARQLYTRGGTGDDARQWTTDTEETLDRAQRRLYRAQTAHLIERSDCRSLRSSMARLLLHLLLAPLNWTIESMEPKMAMLRQRQRQFQRQQQRPAERKQRQRAWSFKVYPFGCSAVMDNLFWVDYELTADELRMCYVQAAFGSVVFDESEQMECAEKNERLFRCKFNETLSASVDRERLVRILCTAFMQSAQCMHTSKMLLCSVLLLAANQALQTPLEAERCRITSFLLSLYDTVVHMEVPVQVPVQVQVQVGTGS